MRANNTPRSASATLAKQGERRTWGSGGLSAEDGYMVATAWVDGRRIKRKAKIVGTGTKAANAAAINARKKLDDEVKRRESGLNASSRSLTFAAFASRWLADEHRRGELAPTTLRTYEDVLKLYVEPYLGRKKLSAVSVADIDAFLLGLRDKGVRQATIIKARGVTSRVLGDAVRLRHLANNPVASARSPRATVPEREREVLDDKETKDLLRAVKGSQLDAAVNLGMLALLRPGEALGLLWSDVDMDAGVINVSRSLAYVAPTEANPGRLVSKAPKSPRSAAPVPIS
jgi:integrase